MATLPSFRRLFKQDYPKESQKLIDILSVTINSAFESLFNALNRNLTLRDNLKATIKDVLVTVDTDGIPTQTTTIALDFSGQVDGVIVIAAYNQTNTAVFPSGAVFISGIQSTKTFIISKINGLQAGQSYLLRVVAFGK